MRTSVLGLLRSIGCGVALHGAVAVAQPAPAAPVIEAAAPPATPATVAPAAVAVENTAIPTAQTPGPVLQSDPWARPGFVKGELGSFAVRPMTRRNFIGIGAGLTALPSSADTALNAFYLTVEPQIDIVNTRYDWRLGLGAPLQFELVDTRGLLEECVAQGRAVHGGGGSQDEVSAMTGACVNSRRDRLTQKFGQLRKADWDEASDFAKVLRYFVVGRQEESFYLNVSRLYDQSFGHGTVVRDYNANLDYNTARLGATLDFSRSAVGVQAMANDLVNPDVVGVMGFVRPMRPYSENVLLRSLSLGVSFVRGAGLPGELKYEPGLFNPSFDEPIPEVDTNLDLVGARYKGVSIVGVDIEGKVVRTQNADVKLYLDYQKMVSFGGGLTLGSLWRFSFGEPARRALRARAEISAFGADYLPSFFDTFHDIFQHQYLPVAYSGSNQLTYYPTKMQYLEASRGGRNRLGGYVELAHSFVDRLTVGVTARTWRPVGSPADAGYVGPSLPDYGRGCPAVEGKLTCAQGVTLKEPTFTSMKLFAELPLRRFLQAFASYEVFSTTAESGLGVFRFDGDNEIFFSGARLMLLPVFFIQAEARRYFFLQRVNAVSFSALTVRQDQNYHANWTFALNAFVGYEF